MKEIQEKSYEEKPECAAAFTNTFAAMGTALGHPQEPCRISLREQIESRFYQAQKAAHESNKLARLQRLIDKNPETFEMISLMRDLGLINF